MILTDPVSSPIAAGSIVIVDGPVMVLDVILIPVPDAPVESCVAVTTPDTRASPLTVSFDVGFVVPIPTF